jgi:hypothetical protein
VATPDATLPRSIFLRPDLPLVPITIKSTPWDAIALILLFPVSLLAALGAFVLLNYIRTRRMLKRAGVDIKRLFKSLSSSTSIGSAQYSPLKYYCMSCGKEHREIACPNCGSKMKRVG